MNQIDTQEQRVLFNFRVSYDESSSYGQICMNTVIYSA